MYHKARLNNFAVIRRLVTRTCRTLRKVGTPNGEVVTLIDQMDVISDQEVVKRFDQSTSLRNREVVKLFD